MKISKGYLIGMTCLDVLIISVFCIMAMFAPMMFDAPGSENSLFLNVFYYSILLLPVISIISVGLAWYKFHKSMTRKALFFISIPLILIIVCIGLFTCIDIFCDGNLTCNI